MNPPAFHNRIREVRTLVAATLIFPALAYAQNNQGDDQGDARPRIKSGIPNGTYVSHITGTVPATPLRPAWFPLRRSYD
jgi:hypothetical protein